jgi:hypothetical protein
MIVSSLVTGNSVVDLNAASAARLNEIANPVVRKPG